MPYGTGRMCQCNNDFCLKSPICDNNPRNSPFESSSGIDLFKMREDYKQTFDINQITSDIKLNQLKNDYNKKWNNRYRMLNIYKIWYDKDSINKDKINLRVYYDYTNGSIINNDNIIHGYWNANVDYNKMTNEYEYHYGSGNKASDTFPGISTDEINSLELIYPDDINNRNKENGNIINISNNSNNDKLNINIILIILIIIIMIIITHN